MRRGRGRGGVSCYGGGGGDGGGGGEGLAIDRQNCVLRPTTIVEEEF